MPEWLKTLSAVVVGGVIVIAGDFALQIWLASQEQKNLVSAFLGDVTAMESAVKQREESWNAQLELLVTKDALREAGGRPWLMPELFESTRMIVFEENAGKLGSLRAPMPQKIAEFYSLSGRLRAEIRLLTGPEILAAAQTERAKAVADHRRTRDLWYKAAAGLKNDLQEGP